jgi:hypothetical protein
MECGTSVAIDLAVALVWSYVGCAKSDARKSSILNHGHPIRAEDRYTNIWCSVTAITKLALRKDEVLLIPSSFVVGGIQHVWVAKLPYGELGFPVSRAMVHCESYPLPCLSRFRRSFCAPSNLVTRYSTGPQG